MRRRARSYLMLTVILVGLTAGVCLGTQQGFRLLIRGKIISNDVRLLDGRPYVPLADMAKHLDLSVVRRGADFNLSAAAEKSRQVIPLNSRVKPVSGSWVYSPAKLSISGSLFQGFGRINGSPGDFVTFDIRGWDRFMASAGVEDSLPVHSVDLQIDVDREHAQSLKISSGEEPVAIDIPLSGHKTVTIRCLEVSFEDGRQAWQSDHGASVLAEPRLIKGEGR